ncbi:hypothetical protein NL676_008486 [Syzygium grande]|nr:hypothetical protein NL676_008486 [Syzygium grande]
MIACCVLFRAYEEAKNRAIPWMISLYRSDRGGMAWRSVIWNFGVKVALSVPALLGGQSRSRHLLLVLAGKWARCCRWSASLASNRKRKMQEGDNRGESTTRGRRRSSDGGWQLRVLRCGGDSRVLSVASSVASTVVMAHLRVVVVRVICEILGRSRSKFDTQSSLSTHHREKLTEQNYPIWKAQITPYLLATNLLSVLDGLEPAPPQHISHASNNGTPVPNPEYKAWRIRDSIAMGWILNSSTSPVVAQLTNHTSAAAIWRYLSDSYAAQSIARASAL